MTKPAWLSKTLVLNDQFQATKLAVKGFGMVTVCEEAHCPNLNECWHSGTATFMIMGDACTRACRFCNIKNAFPALPLDPAEPARLARAVKAMKLHYAVITSVDRDDLPDQGAGHFANCIRAVKERNPSVVVEVLTPDFKGNEESIRKVVGAGPTVFGHNLETVERLQAKVRDPRAGYAQSLRVLEKAKKLGARFTKSSLMLGLGEKREEVLRAMDDLRENRVDILTLGQYLRPSDKHLAVDRFVTPEEFEEFKQEGLKKGFAFVASGPFVRSSYRAGELFVRHMVSNNSKI